MKQKVVLLIMCIALLFTSITSYAASFSDISAHWAEAAIIKWADYGVINGYDGKFAPDDELTRAQMATILSNLLGLSEKSGNTYADVTNDSWYADAILKCTKAGIMSGDGTNANPDKAITREEAMVMIARALDVDSEYTLTRPVNDFTDVSNWAMEFVYALYNQGYVNGVGDNMLMPKENITRAAIITIFNNMITKYITAPGEYEITDGEKFVVLKGNGIVLKSQLENLNIVIADEYDFTIKTPEKTIISNEASSNSQKASSGTGDSSGVNPKKHSVRFYGMDNTLLSQQQVTQGASAIPPEASATEGYIFDGWDSEITNISENKQINAKWTDTTEQANCFAIPCAYGAKDSTIRIPLILTGNVDLCGFDLTVAFNPEVLEFVEFENEDDDIIVNCDKEKGAIHVNFSSTKNINGGIDICDILFKVIKTDEQSSVDIDVVEAIKVLDNGDFEKLNCNVHNAQIKFY